MSETSNDVQIFPVHGRSGYGSGTLLKLADPNASGVFTRYCANGETTYTMWYGDVGIPVPLQTLLLFVDVPFSVQMSEWAWAHAVPNAP